MPKAAQPKRTAARRAPKGKARAAAEPAKVGRPTKFTPETRAVLLDAITRGATYRLACQAAGITFTTFREWVTRGEAEDEGEFAEFSDAVKSAEALCALLALDVIRTAGLESWQSAAWLLERRYSEGYGRKTSHEHAGPGGGPIPHEHRRRDIAREALERLTEAGISHDTAVAALRSMGVRDEDFERVS